MEKSLLIILGVLFGGLILAYLSSKLRADIAYPDSKTSCEPELTDRFCMGKYLGGIPDEDNPLPLVYCGIIKNYFVFRRGIRGVEIGRIRRDAVNKIVVIAKANLSSMLRSKLRIKDEKSKKYCLIMNWNDSQGGTKHDAVFEIFDQPSEAKAYEVADKLTLWIRDKFFTRQNDETEGREISRDEQTGNMLIQE